MKATIELTKQESLVVLAALDCYRGKQRDNVRKGGPSDLANDTINITFNVQDKIEAAAN